MNKLKTTTTTSLMNTFLARSYFVTCTSLKLALDSKLSSNIASNLGYQNPVLNKEYFYYYRDILANVRTVN